MAKTDELATLVTQDARPSRLSFTLHVVSGPDAGATFPVPDDGSRILVGQSSSCGARLTDPEVSRRHAALELMPEGLRLTDLGSTNGTFVDRVRVLGAILMGDEVLRFGGTVMRLDADEHEREPAPAKAGPDHFGRVIGQSQAMRRLYPMCQRLAATDVAVVIEGETGTGKEALAEAIHECGPRARGPFVVFDCTAVAANLLESELFGHERGAFTGAVAQRKGVFEQAHGGTLLIDEIGELELSLQPKLLRALERREIRRVGGDRWLQVDVRLLSATRRDLDREVQEGRFRDDLFHRIAVARIELPPLRERPSDIDALAAYFCRTMNGDPRTFRPELLARWRNWSWPGNVRELRNAVARHIALGEDPLLSPAQGAAREAIAAANGSLLDAYVAMPFIQGRDRLVEDFEVAFVEHWLARFGGDIGKAAAATGIGRRYFQ
ncbi:MAG: sigma 54-dependent Fis family transcriptional regulator, partial [Polyangiaceae bacterium]|nr:sigma 54-dependent Fis family transcriptional regulator [Polyangiaceae bacterium]